MPGAMPGAGAAYGTGETLDLLWSGGPASEARGEPPREGAELAPLQVHIIHHGLD